MESIVYPLSVSYGESYDYSWRFSNAYGPTESLFLRWFYKEAIYKLLVFKYESVTKEPATAY